MIRHFEWLWAGRQLADFDQALARAAPCGGRIWGDVDALLKKHRLAEFKQGEEQWLRRA